MSSYRNLDAFVQLSLTMPTTIVVRRFFFLLVALWEIRRRFHKLDDRRRERDYFEPDKIMDANSMKGVLTKTFWHGVKKTFDDALEGPHPKDQASASLAPAGDTEKASSTSETLSAPQATG